MSDGLRRIDKILFKVHKHICTAGVLAWKEGSKTTIPRVHTFVK